MFKANQISETIGLGMILAISGGMMDAYSYIQRGEVFANAQTGNMLLFGVNLSEGNFYRAFSYFCPIILFVAGILLADIARKKANKKLHWRQTSVLLEAVILIGVGFVPLTHNLIANSLTSLACGIQVESFRKIHGKGIATTMCIGNLRSATQNIYDSVVTKDINKFKTGLLYFFIICSFVSGAIIGNILIKSLGIKTIWVSGALLILSFIIMFIDIEERHLKNRK